MRQFQLVVSAAKNTEEGNRRERNLSERILVTLVRKSFLKIFMKKMLKLRPE